MTTPSLYDITHPMSCHYFSMEALSLVTMDQLRTLIASRLPMNIIKRVLLSPNDSDDGNGIELIAQRQQQPMRHPSCDLANEAGRLLYDEESLLCTYAERWRNTVHYSCCCCCCIVGVMLHCTLSYVCHSSLWRCAVHRADNGTASHEWLLQQCAMLSQSAAYDIH